MLINFSKRKSIGIGKGEKKRDKDGRWYILKPNHPLTNKQNYVFRYRLVAEKCLNRYLTEKEVIHHINGIVDDDRPENLYLFSTQSNHLQYHKRKDKSELKSNLIQ